MNKSTVKMLALTALLSTLPMTAMNEDSTKSKTTQTSNQQRQEKEKQETETSTEKTSRWMQWWSNSCTTTKVITGAACSMAAIVVGSKLGVFKVGKQIAKTATVLGGLTLLGLKLKQYIKPKPEEKSWLEEIQNDFFGVCSWVKDVFSTEEKMDNPKDITKIIYDDEEEEEEEEIEEEENEQ